MERSYIVEFWENNRKNIPVKREKSFDNLEEANAYFRQITAKEQNIMALVYCLEKWEAKNGKMHKKKGPTISCASKQPS